MSSGRLGMTGCRPVSRGVQPDPDSAFDADSCLGEGSSFAGSHEPRPQDSSPVDVRAGSRPTAFRGRGGAWSPVPSVSSAPETVSQERDPPRPANGWDLSGDHGAVSAIGRELWWHAAFVFEPGQESPNPAMWQWVDFSGLDGRCRCTVGHKEREVTIGMFPEGRGHGNDRPY